MFIAEKAFGLAAMDFNERARICPKKFSQAVEKHTREDRERGSQGFSRKRNPVSMAKFIGSFGMEQMLRS